MKNIAIFSSGSGTNAQNIMEYFKENPDVKTVLVLSNKKNAKVLERAKKYNVPSFVFSSEEFQNSQIALDVLRKYDVDFIILAGFLIHLPKYLLDAFPGGIVNIHPALLPKYGGKGMYGMNVHKAVKESGDKETGISIHYVNEHYDEGEIIFQAVCLVENNDTAEIIAKKVHKLEYLHYPKVIEKLLKKK